MDPKDVARLKKLGTTPYKPKKTGWDPSVVFFGGSDIQSEEP